LLQKRLLLQQQTVIPVTKEHRELGMKSVELIEKSSLDRSVLKPSIVSTCSSHHTAFVVSDDRSTGAIWDYMRGKILSTISFQDKVSSTSFHPSGRHVLLGFPDRLQICNILFDGIECVWEAKARLCVDVRFNISGNLFAVLCSSGLKIEVFDFMYGKVINTIDCVDVPLRNLRWSENCSIYATCEDGYHLYKWDALTREKNSVFSSSTAQVIGYTVGRHCSVTMVCNDNAIKFFDEDLKCTSYIQVDDSLMTGCVCVSTDDLVFVGMRRRDNVNFVRVYTITGDSLLDHIVNEAICTMNISHDDRFLLTSNAVLQVRDRRGFSQTIITATFDSTNVVDHIEEDAVTDVMISRSYRDARDAVLNDLISRRKEVEMMNEVHLQKAREIEIDDLKAVKGKFEAITSKIVQELSIKLEEKEKVAMSTTQSTQEYKSGCLREVNQIQVSYKSKILETVKSHCTLEKEWEKESIDMNKRKQTLILKQEREMKDLNELSTEKLLKQEEILLQLQSEKSDAERQYQQSITELEDEIDEEIILHAKKFETEAMITSKTCDQLKLENGVLLRKLENTRQAMDESKEKRANLQESEMEMRLHIISKKDELQSKKSAKKAKKLEIELKKDAVNRLKSINNHLLKTRSIEEYTLQEVQIYSNGPKIDKMKEIETMIAAKLKCLHEIQNVTETLEKRTIRLQDFISAEKNLKSKMENQIRYQNSMIQKSLILMQNCRDHIQNPSNLMHSVQKLASRLEKLSLGQCIETKNNETNFAQDDESMVKNVEMILQQRTYEFECLKAEDYALTAMNRKGKAEQIQANTKLLEKLSKKKT